MGAPRRYLPRAWLALLAGAAILVLLRASAYAAELRHVGILLLDAACPTPAALVKSLAELGWIEDQTIGFDCTSVVGRLPELGALAAAMVARRPDVIASGYSPAIAALKAASASIPIVMLNVADPVRYGLIESLSRPGGNVTGLASALGELDGKRIELLREAVPKFKRLAVLALPSFDAMSKSYEEEVNRTIATAAQRYNFAWDQYFVSQGERLPALFRELPAKGTDAVYPVPSGFLRLNAATMARSALANKLPMIGYTATDAEAGMLLSYGPDQDDLSRRAASTIDKILKGAKAGELPVEQPTAFDLVINLASAKALRIAIPPSLLLRATRVIE